MKRLTILFAILLFWAGCLSVNAQKNARQPKIGSAGQTSADTATVFLTGNILSMLKPCGCAAGQLGGFERRAAILDKVAREKRFVVDVGNLLSGDSDQDVIKFGVIVQAMSMLEYDLANFTADDLRVANSLGLPGNTPFEIISSAAKKESKIPVRYTHRLQLKKQSLSITVAAASDESLQTAGPEDIFGENGTGLRLNILILETCDKDIVKSVKDIDVDVIICPAEADEPRIISGETQKPLVITVGRLGRYFGKLTAGPGPDGKVKLSYSAVPIDEKLAKTPALVELYEDYQFMVQAEELLERISRVPPPEGVEFMGSEMCSGCHETEYEKWLSSRHSHAYQSLVEKGSQFDPECIECHVVGMRYEGGFVSENSPEDLRNVGCEVCHGPRSKHIYAVSSDEPNPKPAKPVFDCGDCHTPEHSPGFQADEAKYREQIRH